MKIEKIACGMANVYLLHGDNSGILIDTGAKNYKDKVLKQCQSANVKLIVLTHGHFDHIWGVEALRAAANEVAENHGYDAVKVFACKDEKELLQNAYQNVSENFGRACTVEADVYVRDGEELEIAGIRCRVIATPGHTAGGCCYYFEEAGFCICGDTIFQESVGRTDFPTGSMSTLVRSIREKLFVLPEETKLYPGHGGSTTVEHEKKYNPFCV